MTPLLLVTRPRDQALTWVQELQGLGLRAAAVPLLGIDPLPPGDPLAAARDIARLRLFGLPAASSRPSGACRLAVFVSPNAVQHFFAQPPGASGAAFVWPSQAWAAAPGPGTAAALQACGVPAERILQPAPDSPQFDSASLWKTLQCHDWRGCEVLVVRGEGGREELMEHLQAAGAQVQVVSTYRRGPPTLLPPERQQLWASLCEPRHALWLFSSSEALGHLLPLVQGLLHDPPPTQPAGPAAPRSFDPESWAAQVPALATHPRIVEHAHRLGFKRTVACRPGLTDVAVAAAAYNSVHREP